MWRLRQAPCVLGLLAKPTVLPSAGGCGMSGWDLFLGRDVKCPECQGTACIETFEGGPDGEGAWYCVVCERGWA
jgi:RecJ-like exonuclease